jgi:hypothetical protein
MSPLVEKLSVSLETNNELGTRLGLIRYVGIATLWSHGNEGFFVIATDL